jgi:small subunit ribosomal protein S9
MAAKSEQITVVGRRKCAVARVRMVPGTGQFTINRRTFEDFFPSATVRGYVTQPLMITGTTGSFDFQVTMAGGGIVGQAGALRHGIARALETSNPEFRTVLKQSGMITRDSRVKERKKPGQPGARKRFQFSKR